MSDVYHLLPVYHMYIKVIKFSGFQSAAIRKTNLLLFSLWVTDVFCSSFTAPVSYEQSDTSRHPFKCDCPSVTHSKHVVDEKNVTFTEVTKR